MTIRPPNLYLSIHFWQINTNITRITVLIFVFLIDKYNFNDRPRGANRTNERDPSAS